MVPRRLAALGVPCALGLSLALAACASSSHSATPRATPRPSIDRTTVTPSTTPSSAPPTSAGPVHEDALHRAIVAYETRQGIPPGSYVITGVVYSPLDPAWAKFGVGATPADQATFQGGYGIAHMSGSSWSVVGFGSAEVGCAPGPTVPPTVLTSFGLSCPAGG